MGPVVGPASQRRSRHTFLKSWRPVGGNGGEFTFCSKQFQVAPLQPRLVPRYGPPRARAGPANDMGGTRE
eukprot:gene18966-biopygen11502